MYAFNAPSPKSLLINAVDGVTQIGGWPKTTNMAGLNRSATNSFSLKALAEPM
jgi:hypothetical protein